VDTPGEDDENGVMRAGAQGERLRGLESVTDSALSYLPLEELLQELLRRVVEILDADTAAILLLEDDGATLAARAAHGLEEEVRRGVRIPVGRGFAGRIAATRQPVRIVDIATADIANPILRERGLKSLLGVPLLVEGRVIGVLHVGTLHQRNFSDDDTQVLQRAGDRAALAIYGRLMERERGLADALQRSLMPALPDVPGMRLAGRYLPAAGAHVGGDWYDAFPLPSGELGLTIGDVVGRGFHAAALMGQLRSGLRAYATQHRSPAEVLFALSGLIRQLAPGHSATVLYLVVDPERGTATAAGGGHPAPIVTREGEASFVEMPGSVPLGTVRHPHYEEVTLESPQGSTLVLYSDGVVERPGDDLERRLAALRDAASGAGSSPDAVCESIVAAMLGDSSRRDDAALLAAHVERLSDSLSLSVPSEIDALPILRRVLRRWLVEHGASDRDVEELALACSEACANAIEHAYSPPAGRVELEASISGDRTVALKVHDFGRWRPPRGAHRGRGMLLMEGLADAVEVVPRENGTSVQLLRKLGARPS
jgi:serine phosphatase RsbU (regulator of sigma subunit)/anti-sigma regulatory factor (Ser/Thr protein kinase)